MKPDFYLSHADLAEALGLSVSTLKRWTDKGLLHVERTPGGHRRISTPEALRFVRDSGLKPVLPHRLGLSPAERGIADGEADQASRICELLVAGKAEDARRFIVSAFSSGIDVAHIGDVWLRPAFERLGELWRHGSEGIVLEHQASDAILRAIGEMRALVEAPRDAPVAVGGSVSGDPYLIPSALAGLVLAVCGFHSINLGADVPKPALFAAIDRFKPRLVWMSVSVPESPHARPAALTKLHAEVETRGAALIVGGGGAPERAKGVTVGRDLRALAAFARGVLA